MVVGATAFAWGAVELGTVRALDLRVALVILGLLSTLVTSSLFFSGVGPPILAVTLSRALMIGLGDPEVAIVVPVLVVGIWYVGGLLDLAWFPVPSEDRFSEAGMMVGMVGFFLAYPVFAWDHIPASSPQGMLLLSSASLLVFWTFVVTPRLHRSMVSRYEASSWRERLVPWGPRKASNDALYLAEYAWLHRRRRLSARTLAVALAIVPVLIILNSIDLASRAGLSDVTSTDASLLAWPGEGRLVDASLLDSTLVLALPEGGWEPIGYEAAVSDLFALPRTAEPGEVSEYAVGSPEAIRRAVADGDGIWVPLEQATAGPGPPGFRRIQVLEVTPADLRSRDWQKRLTAPMALMLVFLGVLVLWRGHDEGLVAWLAGLWAFGAGATLALMPSDNLPFPFVLELIPLQELLVSEIFSSGLLALAHGFLVVLVALTLLLVLGTVSGVIPSLLVAEWVLSTSDSQDSATFKRFAYRFGALAAPIGVWSVGFGVAQWNDGSAGAISMLFEVVVPIALLTTLIVAVYRVGVRLFGPAHGRLPHLALLALPWLYRVVPYAVAAGGGLTAWSVLAMIGLWLVCAAILYWFVIWEDTWNLGGGRAGPTLGMAVVLPVGFALVQSFTEKLLVDWQVVPRSATAIATLILFGLLLRPLFTRLRAFSDWLLFWPLRDVLPRIPELMARVLRSSDDEERRAAIKDVLEGKDIGLENYLLFTRKGVPDDRFYPLARGGEEIPVDAPDLYLSRELLEDLVSESGFLDLEAALEDPRFASTVPELWRVTRILRTTCRSRWQYVLPLTVGPAVLGPLFVAGETLDKNRRRDRFAQCVSDLGVASI